MKTQLLVLALAVHAAVATCNLRNGECVARVELIQQFSLNPFTWQTQLQNAFFGAANQALGAMFTQLYGEDESATLVRELQTCETSRSMSAVTASMRASMLTYQFLTLCSNANPVTSTTNLFTQVVSIVMPLISPCQLDEDIVADLVAAQLLAYITTNQGNSTNFQAGSSALLNLTQTVFSLSENVLGNFSNSLTSLADRGLVDPEVVPQLIDLLQSTLTSVEDLYGQAITEAQTDLEAAIQDTEDGSENLINDLTARLQDLGVPQTDIDSLANTLDDVTNSVTTTMTLIENGDQSLEDAESSLYGLSGTLTQITTESLRILIDIVAQSMDEYCTSATAAA